MIGAKGMERIYEIKLSDDEKAMLQKTVGGVQKTVGETKL
jgi:malate/lactate dehydrogenase